MPVFLRVVRSYSGRSTCLAHSDLGRERKWGGTVIRHAQINRKNTLQFSLRPFLLLFHTWNRDGSPGVSRRRRRQPKEHIFEDRHMLSENVLNSLVGDGKSNKGLQPLGVVFRLSFTMVVVQD